MSLRMTTEACPTQWEGVTTSGKEVYCRYRYGILTINVGGDLSRDILGDLIYTASVGNNQDGCMSTEELLQHLAKAGVEA